MLTKQKTIKYLILLSFILLNLHGTLASAGWRAERTRAKKIAKVMKPFQAHTDAILALLKKDLSLENPEEAKLYHDIKLRLQLELRERTYRLYAIYDSMKPLGVKQAKALLLEKVELLQKYEEALKNMKQDAAPSTGYRPLYMKNLSEKENRQYIENRIQQIAEEILVLPAVVSLPSRSSGFDEGLVHILLKGSVLRFTTGLALIGVLAVPMTIGSYLEKKIRKLALYTKRRVLFNGKNKKVSSKLLEDHQFQCKALLTGSERLLLTE